MNHAYLPPEEPRCRPSQHCDRAQHCCRSLVPLPAAGGRVEDYTIWRTPLFNDCAAFVPVGQFTTKVPDTRPVRPYIKGL
jgi:hypothetical protein